MFENSRRNMGIADRIVVVGVVDCTLFAGGSYNQNCNSGIRMVNTQPEVAEEVAGGSTATAKLIAHLRHSDVVLVEARDEGVPMQQYYN